MSVVKYEGKTGPRWRVFCYDSAVKRKRYFGSYPTEKEALRVFRDVTNDLEDGKTETVDPTTCRAYADYWLDKHHGEHTPRPASSTYRNNEGKLRQFVKDFGDRPIRGGITRGEALTWCRKHRHNATTIAAMFNDAFNDEKTDTNPFADRRQSQSRGRKDIHPVSEAELEDLAALAVSIWGENYGMVVRGWILFMAWTGMRPGEVFKASWSDLDFASGNLTVTRIKGRKQTERIIFPSRAQEAVLSMPVDRSGLLFPSVNGQPMDKGHARYYFDPVRKAWLAAMDPSRAQELCGGRPSFDPYALRHHCGSYLAKQGLNEFEIAVQLGNSPQVCRETYIHPFVDDTQDRIRQALEGGRVSDLDAARKRRSA